jgi:hypothetical protein
MLMSVVGAATLDAWELVEPLPTGNAGWNGHTHNRSWIAAYTFDGKQPVMQRLPVQGCSLNVSMMK